MSYKLSPTAKAQLDEIFSYSVRKFGLPQARLYVEDLHAIFELLALRPHMGRKWRRWRRHEHAQHVIFYRESADGIGIVQIFHHRENIVAKMKS